MIREEVEVGLMVGALKRLAPPLHLLRDGIMRYLTKAVFYLKVGAGRGKSFHVLEFCREASDHVLHI
jgi:hypothetical protein